MPKRAVSPVRQQYLNVKRRHPDAILFFRLGDFYETFDEDAEIVARELDIVLTSRNMAKGHRVPMAGVPCRAAESYIAKLVKNGHRVAICEQVGSDAVDGLVPREVVRVATPGTVTESDLLEDKRSNYLAAVLTENQQAALSYVDITTGEFAATQISPPQALERLSREIERLQPAECLVPEGSPWTPSGCHVTLHPDWQFELENGRRALIEHFQVATLDGFGCAGLPLATRTAGAIVQYLAEIQKPALRQLTHLSTYSIDRFMDLDPTTTRNLELFRGLRDGSERDSLLSILDATRTPMGGRLLRSWLTHPLLDVEALEERLDAVSVLHRETAVRTGITDLLNKMGDLERVVGRVAQDIASPRDLLALKTNLELVPELLQLMKSIAAESATLAQLPLNAFDQVVALIGEAISPDAPASVGGGRTIAPGFSPELDRLAAASRDAKQWIANLERSERQRTGIKSLKVGHNKVFGYYLEVSKANLKLVPDHYIRKQTLVNGERYITPELKEYESLVLNAEERMAELEAQAFRQVCVRISAVADKILATARGLAHLDVFASLAEVAHERSYVRPALNDGDEILIVQGRHPVVESMLADEPFVPNDAHLSNQDRQLILLTGPNMAGKSTYLRQVALIVLIAQIGSFVPAESATIGLVDRIFTRVGAQDIIAAGQSTFMVEMVETAYIMNHATNKSLIVLDEIGRGTSTYDGISIAWAVVEHIHNHPRLRAKTLFATHYHELTELAKSLPRVHNCNVAVAEEGDNVVFLRKIQPGPADRSYGIHVAKIAGLPRAVIRRAEEILAQLEATSEGGPGAASFASADPDRQPALFSLSHPIVEELKALDTDSLTPLDALNLLYRLKQELGDD